MKKILVFAAAAAALAALLSVGQHVLVSGPRLRKLVNAKPEELLVEYDAATAWIPGTLRLTNLRVRGRDSNVEWEVRMPAARLDYAPLSLVSRTFRMRRLSGSGLEFRLRERQEPGKVSRNAELFPEIEGFSDPPLRDPNEPPPHVRTSPPWTIRLDALDADPARLIWIGPWRYDGDARVTGGFTLQPGWRADIGPAAIEFRRVSLSMGKDVVLADAHGAVSCRIEPFDVRQVKGSAVWPYIGGRFNLAGRVEALDFLRHVVDERSAPALRKGHGEASVDVRIEKGVGKGEATVQAAGTDATTSGGALHGDLAARAELSRWELERGDMDVSGSRLELKNVTASTRGGAEPGWWGTARIVRGRIHDGLDARVAARCRDARPLYRLFSVEMPGWAEKMLELQDLEATARLRLATGRTAFEGLSVTGGEYKISGEYEDVRGRDSGVFLVEKGKLAVAVQVQGDKKSLRPLGAREWYQVAAEEHRRQLAAKK
jgi:hypothetical protein